MTSGLTSLRQFARLIGKSEKAIRKAVAAGVFRKSLHRDPETGTPAIADVGLALDEWEKSGRQLRTPRAREEASPSRAPIIQAEVSPAAEAPADDDSAADDGEEFDTADAGDSQTLVAAQRMAVLERARKLKLENDLREGQLVEAGLASRQAFEFARTLRENVLNLPARLSAELAAESDAGRVFLRLDGALREALDATAAALEAAG